MCVRVHVCVVWVCMTVCVCVSVCVCVCVSVYEYGCVCVHGVCQCVRYSRKKIRCTSVLMCVCDRRR